MVRSAKARVSWSLCFSLSAQVFFKKPPLCRANIKMKNLLLEQAAKRTNKLMRTKNLWKLFLSSWLRCFVHSSLSHDKRFLFAFKTFQLMNLKSFITKLLFGFQKSHMNNSQTRSVETQIYFIRSNFLVWREIL